MGIMGTVPNVVREQNEETYSPTTISIGPLQREKEHLEEMEPVKLSYTHALLGRVGALEKTMELCAAAMLEMEEDVWNSYDPATLPPNTQENVRWLAEVILIDACFIIELLWRNYHRRVYNDDPIFRNAKYFAIQLSILHFLHIFLQPQQSNHIQVDDRKYDEIEKMERRMKYSATQIRLAGVEFKRAPNINPFDIKFTTSFSFISCWFMFRKGHIEIPRLFIFDSTESFLRNLIALELSWPSIGSHFTSFAFFMDLLIDTPEDVKLLEEARIIYNFLDSDKEVARLFNGICSNIATAASRFHFSKQYQEAMDFCKHPWRVAIKNLRQDYFGNPWTGISVIAAIILFVLTFISTLYTTLSYYH